MRLLVLLCALVACVAAQVVSKDVIDFCHPDDPKSCGERGRCKEKRTGNRCECPRGWMGRGCARPCQDVYRSCKRWKEEERCSWTRPISPFFTDNCALSCGFCQGDGKRLALALPPILDSIAWLVGRWEARTTSGERFPEAMSGPYAEVLEVQISDVPMFDRPPVNISVYAATLDGQDVHRELGFMTGKPFHEDTGFVDFDKPAEGDDLVAIELVSNTGLSTIEEGIVLGESLKIETKHKKSMIGWWKEHKESKRMFKLVSPDMLEERVIVTDAQGNTKKWLKRYRKTFDYLTAYEDA